MSLSFWSTGQCSITPVLLQALADSPDASALQSLWHHWWQGQIMTLCIAYQLLPNVSQKAARQTLGIQFVLQCCCRQLQRAGLWAILLLWYGPQHVHLFCWLALKHTQVLLFLCRFTCENVVRVLRSNKDSVMAMLEAFVHDPLINWRLLNTTTDAVDAGNTPTADSSKCSNCACYVFIPCLALESSMYSLEYACCVSALIMLRRKDTLLDTLACIVAFQWLWCYKDLNHQLEKLQYLQTACMWWGISKE